ncbi:MAG TPA: hypothetical protein VFX12_09870 [Vicinamibacterales bacterium]|nr:hypothetical protein [Vicinamibacterales bacterium]
MPSSPPTIELRLSLPVDGAFRSIASALVAKLAAHCGCAPDQMSGVETAFETAVMPLVNGAPEAASLDLTLAGMDHAVTIRAARGDRHAETTCRF